MDHRPSLAAALCAAAVAAPIASLAQSGTANYYTPPKLVKRGTSSAATGAAGTVVVQVFVAKSGAAKVSKVLRSTAHADDAAALEIAKNSTYAPAKRGSAAIDAFYDFTLKFTSSGVAADVPAGGLAAYERMIRAGSYQDAQTGLKAYVAEHAGDKAGQLDLGLADAYLDQYADAAAAFDAAGATPPQYAQVAAKAYAETANAALKSKDYPSAVAAAKRSVAIAPTFYTYNTLGSAEDAAGDDASAVADYEKARAFGASTNAPAKQRATVDVNLAAAYAATGDTAKAKAVAAESAQLDPSQSGGAVVLGNGYQKTAQTQIAAGKFAAAAATLEAGAADVPSQAASLYAQAALQYLKLQPQPDNAKAQADADKALALAPDDALANYAKGIALANQAGKAKDALASLGKADASAKAAGDTGLQTSIEAAMKQLANAR